eukprot:SAG31_NODE_21134_length_557_cov_0.838428_1_plen_34_part_01
MTSDQGVVVGNRGAGEDALGAGARCGAPDPVLRA